MTSGNVRLYTGLCIAAVIFISGGALRSQEDRGRHPSLQPEEIQKLNDRFRNAIVRVESIQLENLTEIRLNPHMDPEPGGRAHGSGFFISENEILTNAHVVIGAREGSIRIKSPATGNTEFKVEVVGTGMEGPVDLAILRLPEDELTRFKLHSGLKKIQTLVFDDSSKVKQSDPVLVFGYPLASDELKVIQAEVTGRHYLTQEDNRFPIRHQFIEVGPGGTVQPGNSGGPAMNSNGKIVGIPTAGNYRGSQGWLIPSNIVTAFLDRIRAAGPGIHPLLAPDVGIVFEKNSLGKSILAGLPRDMATFEIGVLVQEVLPDRQGALFGLKAGDVLVGFANENKRISCALDFEGYRVVTGRMATWPEDGKKPPKDHSHRLHLEELFFTSDAGDEVSLWFFRPGETAQNSAPTLQKVTRKIALEEILPLPRIGLFQSPDYVRWGGLVFQELNRFNASYFDLSDEETRRPGLLVTFIEEGSPAAQQGLMTCQWGRCMNTWYRLEAFDGKAAVTLAELRERIIAVQENSRRALAAVVDQSERRFIREKYASITVRTTGQDGEEHVVRTVLDVEEAALSADNLETPSGKGTSPASDVTPAASVTPMSTP